MKKIKRWFGSAKNQMALAGGAAMGLVGMSAQAAVDTTAVTTALTDAGAAVAVVGAAVLAVKVGGKTFRYIASQL